MGIAQQCGGQLGDCQRHERGSCYHHSSQPDQGACPFRKIRRKTYEYENQTRSCGQHPEDGGGLPGETSVHQTAGLDRFVQGYLTIFHLWEDEEALREMAYVPPGRLQDDLLKKAETIKENTL